MGTAIQALDVVLCHWESSPSYDTTRAIAEIVSSISRRSVPSVQYCREKLSKLREESRELCTQKTIIDERALSHCVEAASRGIPPSYAVLRHAISNENVDLVRMALRGGVDVHGGVFSTMFPPIILAASVGNADILCMLLDAGANVDQKSRYGWTPLLCAKSATITKLLVSAGANPNVCDDMGRAPLFLAAEDDDLDKVRALLASPDILVDCTAFCGETPLMIAARGGFVSVAKALVSSGADPNARNDMGSTPLLAGTGHPEMIELLMKAGAISRENDRKYRHSLTALDMRLPRAWKLHKTRALMDRTL